MKHMILSALCTLLFATSVFAQASYQKNRFASSGPAEMIGNDKGNGGDAILIDNEMVMRDFVARASFSQVENNREFLDSVPGFRALITEIAKANGPFAYAILEDLMSASIYLSESDLDVLSPQQTAIGGPKADVQLAIRWQNEIVISPKFFKPEFKKQRAYLLVHEALHGVLYENQGALHHHRVRMIVNYLKTQNGKYESEKLAEILKKNNFGNGMRPVIAMAFDKSLQMALRCYALSVADFNATEEVRKYLEVSCSEFPFKAMESYVTAKVGMSYVGSEDPSGLVYVAAGMKPARYPLIDLVKTGLFQKKLKEFQQDRCFNSRYEGKTAEEQLKEVAVATRIVKDVRAYLARTDIRKEEKELVRYFMENNSMHYLSLEESSQKLSELNTILLETRKNTKSNDMKCVEMFGQKLGYL